MNTIQWGSPLEKYPPLEFQSPQVTDQMRQQAVERIPAPQHCKPWIDGQSAGLVLRWPFERTLIQFVANWREIGGSLIEHEDGPVMKVTPDDANVARFAPNHFSLLPLYVFKTPPNTGLYVTGLPHTYNSPIPQSCVVRGVLETDWYPSPPFFVFETLHVGTTASIILEYGDPLCLLIPVVLNPKATEMSTDEVSAMLEDHGRYQAEKISRDDLLWMAKGGNQMFSHIYKEKSKQHDEHRNS